ncbi:hypothetical protein ACFWU3_32720 [Streptomyces sp. NPDC058685]|uniref:hypothetical protein n=1 Tax=Streptomyces sp. NPDC058685 TaxID=3346598 RepID=UPI003658898E
MTTAANEHAPIYERLVQERGDVLAETRKTAAQTQREAGRALDWSDLRLPQKDGKKRAFSAFG